MSAQTLTTLEAMVRNLIFEEATDTGLVDTGKLDQLINIANAKVWKMAVRAAPSRFKVPSADKTFVAATGYYDYGLAVLDANGVHEISFVEAKVSGVYYPVVPLQTEQDRDLYEPSVFPQVAYPGIPSHYYLQGDRLYLTPPPSSNQTLRITYIPGLAALVNPTDVPIAAKLPDYHELVAFEAAILAFKKDEATSTPWDQERNDLLTEMKQDLARVQGQRTNRVRCRPF